MGHPFCSAPSGHEQHRHCPALTVRWCSVKRPRSKGKVLRSTVPGRSALCPAAAWRGNPPTGPDTGVDPAVVKGCQRGVLSLSLRVLPLRLSGGNPGKRYQIQHPERQRQVQETGHYKLLAQGTLGTLACPPCWPDF